MAEQKISELPIATALTGAEKIPVNQNAVTSITDVNAILAYTLASQTIKFAKVTITSAQLLNSFTTPLTLVAAQGAGKVIIPFTVLLRYRFGTIEYATNLNITLSPNSSLYQVNYNSAISGNQDKYSSRSITPTVSLAGSVVDNLPLTIGAQIGNPTAGDGQLDVYVSYYVLTL
jgi:histidine ammonia-lyase